MYLYDSAFRPGIPSRRQARKASSYLAKWLNMLSAYLDLVGPQSLAAHVILHLAGDALPAGVGELVLRLQLRLSLAPSHERKPRRARKPLSVVEIPLYVDDLRPSVHHHRLAHVEAIGPRGDALVAHLDVW